MTLMSPLKNQFLFARDTNYIEIMGLQYFTFFILFLVICIFVYLLVKLPQILNKYKKNLLKDTVYECGFDAFQSAKIKFNIHFFAIAILFLLFDLEIMLLFPWAVVFRYIPPAVSFASCILFCLLLLAGFIFEWFSGILDLISQTNYKREINEIKLFRKSSIFVIKNKSTKILPCKKNK